MADQLLKYKIAVGLIPGIGSVTAKKLIAYTGGIEGVFSEKKGKLQKIPGIGNVLAENIVNCKALERAGKEIEFIEKFHIGYSFYLDDDYPERLKNCEDSPIMLYYKGNPSFNSKRILSIVGTRNATEYGRTCCERLIEDLKNRGHELVIVSGLAYGVDICAHRAALKYGFETFAVLGHGLGTLYPAVHKATAKEIIAHGALVSDFVSDTMPDRNNFVKRNRLIAGMADATLVVESGLKGGALITADLAQSYNRDVLAFPGRVGDAYSLGCNWLIKTNKAALVESALDIEYHLGWDSPQKPVEAHQTSLFVEMTEDEQRIVKAFNGDKELPIDIISVRSEMPVGLVSAQLLSLEFAGKVKSLPGKMYRLL